MKCPSASVIAERFVKFAPGRASRYEDGVRNPAEDWEKTQKELSRIMKKELKGQGMKWRQRWAR